MGKGHFKEGFFLFYSSSLSVLNLVLGQIGLFARNWNYGSLLKSTNFKVLQSVLALACVQRADLSVQTFISTSHHRK
jgi:hypothetical protein